MSTATVDESEIAEAATGGEPVALPSVRSLASTAGFMLRQTDVLLRELVPLAREEFEVLLGRSDVEPDSRDRRFRDEAWESNPFYRRLEQSYLAWARHQNQAVDRLHEKRPDDRRVEAARFLTGILVSAASPTNTLFGNPTALKKAFDTGGASLVRGLRNFLQDLRRNGGMPSQVDRTAFTVGEDLAITPGSVVYRSEIAELIHYAPTTDEVASRPVLIVPPPIGRYYFLDLRPGRSFAEYAVSRGLDTYMLSWRNPTPSQSAWGMDDYAAEILELLDVVREVSAADRVNPIGFCAGGILLTTVLNHLAAEGDDRVNAAAYAVTLLDFGTPAPIDAFASPRLLELARTTSTRKGVISAQAMGNVFSWMRPDDLVFSYVVNNWLLGEDPPAFDILAWNADGTNLPARLHEQFLEIFKHNPLTEPGGMTVLGTPVDLSRIKVPIFVTGGNTDHLTPWRACYRTTQLLSGESTFVLSNAGHIASLVNPPGNPKASYQAGPVPMEDPDGWRERAEEHTGSWWEVWADWALSRGGEMRPASDELGSDDRPPLVDAPGLYVRDEIP